MVCMGNSLPNNPYIIGLLATIMTWLAPLADEDLITHRLCQQKLVLQGLHHYPKALESAITQMAIDKHLAHEEKAASHMESKLPSDKFSITIDILQGYFQVPDEKDVPLLWHQWANYTKQ